MRPVRIAVAGTGYGARVALPVYRELAEFEPVAVWSRRYPRARDVANANEVANATSSFDELIAVHGVEAVHVASPVSLHSSMAIAAAERGLHILCEKPLGRSLDDARAIARAVSVAGVVCVVNLGRRFREPRRRLIEAATQVLGRPRFAQLSMVHSDHATSESRQFGWVHDAKYGGGRLQAYGAHDFDLALAALGPVDSVAARLDAQVYERSDGRRIRAVTAEDGYTVLLGLRAGGLAVLSLASTAHHRRGDVVELYGDDGTVRLDAERRLWWARAGQPLRCQGPLRADSSAAFGVVARNFFAAIRHQAPAVPSIDDALSVQSLIDAARSASVRQCWVDVEQP